VVQNAGATANVGISGTTISDPSTVGITNRRRHRGHLRRDHHDDGIGIKVNSGSATIDGGTQISGNVTGHSRRWRKRFGNDQRR